MGYIYKLDFPNGMSYIGATTRTPTSRLKRHRIRALAGVATPLGAAFREYGDPTVTVLEVVEDTDLHAAEVRAIAEWGTLHPGGYNLNTGGTFGAKPCAETRKKLSAAQKGREVTVSARQKARASILARPDYTERCEHLLAYSSTLTHTQETKDRISQTLRTRPDHEAHMARLRALNKGKVISDETKAKMRASALARIDRKRKEKEIAQ